MPEVRPKELWIFVSANCFVENEVTRACDLFRRASACGFSRVILHDAKFARLDKVPKCYFGNLQTLRETASSNGLKILPSTCPIGYSNSFLTRYPNLAEGLPVRSATFKIDGSLAQIQPTVAWDSDQPQSAKQKMHLDPAVRWHEGELTYCLQSKERARMRMRVAVRPFQHYQLTLQLKTDELQGQVQVQPMGVPRGTNGNEQPGRRLCYTDLAVASSQDWTTYKLTFNSLDHSMIDLLIGSWGAEHGSYSIRGIKLESCGAVNLVRSETAPIEVKLVNPRGGPGGNPGGGQGGYPVQLMEGIDFETWEDPLLGNDPVAGSFGPWHPSPPIRLKRDFPNGSHLEVSYYHTHVIGPDQVCAALGNSRFVELLKDHIRRVAVQFPSCDWMMNHDEVRLLGWMPTNIPELGTSPTSEQILTHNVETCQQSIKSVAPQADLWVWSDMFDPYHNAIDQYYLVRDSLAHLQLPESIGVVNWNEGKKAQSLQYFAERGHRQAIGAYYDQPLEQTKQWLDCITTNNIQGVDAFLYTTWKKDYKELESFSELVRSHPWFEC
ncbi:MAG: hypothetical protein RL240_688 [Planctomycetota bacterium]